MLASILVLVLVAALSTLLTAAVMELQAGARTYITSEGHWSRARQNLAHALYRYSLSGDPAELERARIAMRVPLGDRDARLALEQPVPDRARAIQGFREGANAESDLDRMVRTYLFFSGAPYFRDAVRIWREADDKVLQFIGVADRLERHWSVPGAGPAPDEIRLELDRIGEELRPLEREYSETLLRGLRLLHQGLLVLSALMFLTIAAIVVGLHWLGLRRVRDTEERFRAAFQQATVGMVKLDEDGCMLATNEELAGMLRATPQALAGRNVADLMLAPDGGSAHAAMPVDAWDQLDAPIERRLRRHDGSAFWARITASAVLAPRGERSVLLIVEDISEARELSETLARHASHDALTGLINRREIEQRLSRALDDAHVNGARHTLCFLDLDHFKLVNDTASHSAGDMLLQLIAGTVPPRLGPRDWFGRLGGDEFALLFADTGVEQALARTESLQRVLADTSLLWEGRHFSLTSSAGLVQLDGDTPSVAWLLRAADAACYSAKDAGGDQVRVYTEMDRDIVRRRDEMAMANQARAAIVEGRLRLFAQRIVPLDGKDGGLHYEILVRVLDPSGKLCAPAAMLGAAEKYMFATALDRRVLSMTLDVLAQHPAHLERLSQCHINVSAQSAASPEFRAFVGELLDSSPVPASRLCFELTETASIGRLGEARAFIESMRCRGCCIALDDFGSGLSSFAYLKGLPVDVLKIDGQFVRDIGTDPLDFAVVRAVTDVARALGKRTIAEWVESEAVLQQLRALGVDAAQGYAMHRPCPFEQLVEETSGRQADEDDPRPAARRA